MENRSVVTPTDASSSTSARPAAARTKMILEAPILPTLFRLSVPNVLNLLAFVGLITFDGLFVGRLGAAALAGVSLAFPWVMLMQHTAASGMGGGVSSAIARALGAKRPDLADELAAHAFALALVLAALFSILMLAGAPFLYRWMGGEGEVLNAALAYSNAAFTGALSVCMLNLLANVARGTGNMTLPAATIVGSVLLHIIVSPMMIFGFGPIPALGPAGAGWGLTTSFGAGSLVLLGYLRSRRSLVRLRFRGIRLQRERFFEILKVGIPGMINVIITNLSVVVLTGIASHVGRDVAIGYGMGARLEYILIPLAFGFGTAIVTMVGTNWGAKQHARAYQIAWIGGVTVALCCGVIGLFFALFPQLWMGLFSANEEIVRVGSSYLRIVGPMYAFYGLGMALYFAAQGFGNVLLPVAANAARLLAGAGSGLIAIEFFGSGSTGLFLSIGVGFVVYGLLNAIALLRTRPVHEKSSGVLIPIFLGKVAKV
jgi:putative MATE family efflux protein